MTIASTIRDRVEQTPFIDTHEHLIEESERVRGEVGSRFLRCNDWAYLFSHYVDSDLISAGMPSADHARFLAPDVSSEAKYRLVAPWWERIRHTGYAQAIRYTLRGLYGEGDLTADSVGRIAEKYTALVKPGLYAHVLRDKANIESCQVNSLQRIFMESEQPELLRQDLSIVALSTGLNRKQVEAESGRSADTLEGWLEVINWYFAEYGPRAVAVKNQSAYSRRLDYDRVTQDEAAPLFARHARGDELSPGDSKTLQDFLLRYCVGKATEQGLPVKLHTGYYAGAGSMPLHRVRRNASDLCPLLQDFPDTRFVLMHIGYPYQDEFIALAKHYRNVSIDMCWAWIINPAAGVRFVKEFLMAAPANKLFTFGGDYIPVEPVYGHSRIARMGLSQAITELVEEGWIALEETPELIERLMHGNARETFPEPNIARTECQNRG
jgi:predicted TIM-barrel fold metal-dependent hydrolase